MPGEKYKLPAVAKRILGIELDKRQLKTMKKSLGRGKLNSGTTTRTDCVGKTALQHDSANSVCIE